MAFVGQKVTITERDEAHGLIAQRAFGGTSKWRTCYVSDGDHLWLDITLLGEHHIKHNLREVYEICH